MDEKGEIAHRYLFKILSEPPYFHVYALSFEDAKIKLQDAFPDSKWQICVRLDRYGKIEKEWTNEE